jgi:hypothetical protein
MTNKLRDAYSDWAAAQGVDPMTEEQFVDELLRLYPEIRLVHKGEELPDGTIADEDTFIGIALRKPS